MPSVHDVAAYILARKGEMSTWKLQKLVYYSQAWHLVWDEKPLFPEPIQAWANGPVVRVLFEHHRGQLTVKTWKPGKASALSERQEQIVDAVLDFYGDKTGHWLSELTHLEDPWRDTRKGVPDGAKSTRVIRHGAIADYYGNLPVAS